MSWPDGKQFEGEFQNDVKHGHGVMQYPDGRFHEGNWTDGK